MYNYIYKKKEDKMNITQEQSDIEKFYNNNNISILEDTDNRENFTFLSGKVICNQNEQSKIIRTLQEEKQVLITLLSGILLEVFFYNGDIICNKYSKKYTISDLEKGEIDSQYKESSKSYTLKNLTYPELIQQLLTS